jgi:RHS repeat-associated protein
MRRVRSVVVFVVAALLAAVLPVLPAQAQDPETPPVEGEVSPEGSTVDPATIPVEGDGSAGLPDPSWQATVPAQGLPADAAPPLVVNPDGEVPALRTESSRTFSVDPEQGTFRTESFAGPVYYRSAEGGFEPIDLTLIDATSSTGSQVWSVTASGTPVELAARAGTDGAVTVRSGEGESLSWGFAGTRGATGERRPGVGADEAARNDEVAGGEGNKPEGPARAAEIVTYADVWAGVDVEVAPTARGVKEDLVLTSPEAGTVFEFPMALEGLTARVDEATGAVLFTGTGGEVRFEVPKGWMRDSATAHDGIAGAESDGVRYELVGDERRPTLRVTLDEKWLRDPARVFPVRVDPTVTQVGANTDDTYVNSCYTNNYSAEAILKVGGSDCQRAAYMKFDVSAFAGMTIHSATLAAWNGYSFSCSARNVNAYAVTSAWAGSSVTNWPGPSFATPANATSSFAYGYSSSCPGAVGSFDLTGLVAAWTLGWVPNYGVTLRAADTTTSDPFTYKEFYSADTWLYPNLMIEWSDPHIPIGNFEAATGAPGGIRASGWALDRDTTNPIDVHAYVDGVGAAGFTANTYRPDVGAAYPGYGDNHGFDAIVPAARGPRNICAYAINAGAGSVNPQLGCRSVTVPGGSPIGNWELATNGQGDIYVAGWVLDPDTANPINVSISVDGVAQTYVANEARSDVKAAYPNWGPNHGIFRRIPATVGSHSVCVTAIDAVGGDANTVMAAPGGVGTCATVEVTDNGMGAKPWQASNDIGITDRLGTSVTYASGNLAVAGTDLTTAGRGGFGVNIGRAYNSRDNATTGTMGAGWSLTTGTDVRLDTNPAGMIYTGGGGSKVLFTPNGPDYTSPAGINARLKHDSTNNRYELAFYESGVTQYFDATNGRLIAQTDRDATSHTDQHNRIEFLYDGSGRVSTIKDTRNRTITFTYTSGRVTSVTDWTNRTWTYGYTSGRLTTVTDPENKTVTYTYNTTTGNLERITDPEGRQTRFTHTTDDRVHTVKRVNNNTTGAGDITTYAYYIGTAECRPTAPTLYKDKHGCTKVTDARNNWTYHQWAFEGTVTKTVDPEGAFVETGWSSNNNIESYTDRAGVTNTIEYNDVNNRPESATAGTGAQTTIDYDGSIQPANTRRYWQPAEVVAPQATTGFGYDAAGNTTSVTEDVGGAASTTTYEYAADGSVTKATDANGHETSYIYDADGQLEKIDHPDPRGDETFTYDALSRVETHNDGNGTTITLTYDDLDRVTETEYEKSTDPTVTITTTYDGSGNVIGRTDDAGTWTFTHDAQNRLKTKSGPGQPTQRLLYDAVGNLDSYDEDDTGPLPAVTYEYDTRNLVEEVGLPGVTNPILVGYDAAHRRSFTAYPNGVTEHVGYDIFGRLETVSAEKNSVNITQFTYTYKTTGDLSLRASVTDLTGNTTTYDYNTHNRLTSAEQTNSSNTTINDWAYDYDPVGNMTLKTVNTQSTASAFNAANQLCWTVPGLTAPGCDQTPPAGRTEYAYDDGGNMTEAGAQWFDYNHLNQSTAISDPTGTNDQEMEYAGSTQDERLTRDDTAYLTGPFGLNTETTGTHTTRYRYDDTGTILARQASTGDTHYYLRDGLGSIVALTDSTGNIVANYTYDPYGTTLTATGTLAATNPWRYAAGYTDDLTGLVKFGTRYYQPELGRWTQPDHWGPESGYAYAAGDPVNSVDPSGRDACMGAYANSLQPQSTPGQCGQGLGPGSSGVPPAPPRQSDSSLQQAIVACVTGAVVGAVPGGPVSAGVGCVVGVTGVALDQYTENGEASKIIAILEWLKAASGR